MAKYSLSDKGKDILKVIKNEIDYARHNPSIHVTNGILDARVAESEALLRSMGRGDALEQVVGQSETPMPKTVVVRSFDDLLEAANRNHPDEVGFEALFSKAELAENAGLIRRMNEEFNAIHALDAVDVAIPVVAGIFGGAIDCLFGGFIRNADGRNIPGSMSEFIRKLLDQMLPPDRIGSLEELAKVPYDALNYDNKGRVIVNEIVEGLSPIFHHQVALGHDPILGFIFGVLDLLRGTVTTLDFNGKFVIQVADGFGERKAENLFYAIAGVFLHLLSDVNGSSSAKNGGMGLPVPFMALFNTLQFGKIGHNETIAELVKSMFYQGYDFRHFCSMSIPVMIIEVIVRVSYFAKRLHEGASLTDAVPVGLDPGKKPKLATMLFIAHSAATAINAGKVVFSENPLNINYPQWLSFARYSVRQLKWTFADKPYMRDKYVMGIIQGEWNVLSESMDDLWEEYTDGAVVVHL